MQIQTIGIIGYGHFGAFLKQLSARFVPEAMVRVYSRRATPGEQSFVDLRTAAASDVVLLTGSIAEFESQLVAIAEHVLPTSVVVDVSTVKLHTTTLLRKYLPTHPWIATHPMFGPESYQKTSGDVSGYRIAVTAHTLPPEQYSALLEFVRALGFVVAEMTANEHDQLLAETLFMTHYIGQVMQTAGFVRTTIDTVSFGYLMNAVESVAYDEKLFQDVYRFNPYCQSAAIRFHTAQETVWSTLQNPHL